MSIAPWIVLALFPAVPEPPPAAQGKIPITGVVRDAGRKPVAQAEVFLTGYQSSGGWPPVLARARTDAEGKFKLEAPADPDDPAAPNPGALWAYRSGSLVATRAIRPSTFRAELPVEFVLGPPARSAFEVLGPDGKPVAGASIVPRVIDRDASATPDDLGALVAAKTDAQGQALLTAFFPEEIVTVLISAPGLGVQQVGFREAGIGKKRVVLWPVGQVKGRVAAETPKAAEGLEASVLSFHPRQPAPAAGFFNRTTDAQGRFEVAEIPEGRLGVSIAPRAGSPWFGRLAVPAQVVAGKTTEVTVKMRRGVRVHGVVRDRETRAPIARAGVGLGLDQEPVRTDAQGRYEGFVAPGRLFLHLWSAPKPYASLLFGLPDQVVPEGAEYELPPIELTRAGGVRGKVLDGAGRPVVGAQVNASWDVDEGPMRRGRRDLEALTGAEGDFNVDGAPRGAEVVLTASSRGLRTDQPVTTRSNGASPVTLRLGSALAVSLSGRAVTAEGKPIAGARVRVRTRSRDEAGKVKSQSLVDFDGLNTLVADMDGKFRTPPYLAADGEYTALGEADGFDAGQTPWVSGKIGHFADLVLAPEAKSLSPLRPPVASLPFTGSSAP